LTFSTIYDIIIKRYYFVARLLKRVKRLLDNPKSIKFEELDAILSEFGWEASRSGGAHVTYRKRGNPAIITVPFKRHQVKEHYVREVIELLNLEVWYENNRR